MSEYLQSVGAIPLTFSADCPVMITGGELLTEKSSGRPVAKAVIKNLSRNTIISCAINVYAFDENDNRANGVQGFAYSGLSVEYGEEFGGQQLFYLPNNKTASVVVGVASVVFSNGYEWKPRETTNWQMPSFGETLESALGGELARQYADDIGGNCRYIPVQNDGLFLCTCGTPNLAGEVCTNCSRSFEQLSAALNPDRLRSEISAKRAAFARQEPALQQSQPEPAPSVPYQPELAPQAAQEAPKKGKGKKGVILGSVFGAAAVVITALIIFGANVVYPHNQYLKAEEYLSREEISYKEYYDAYTIFDKLGDYKDSRDRSIECGLKFIDAKIAVSAYLTTLDRDVWDTYNALKQKGYSDSEALYNKIYGTRIVLNSFNCSKTDSDTILESIPTVVSYAQFDFQFISGCSFDGTDEKEYDLYHKFFYPGDSIAGDGKNAWHWTNVKSGDYKGCEWTNGWTTRKGTLLVIIYDSSNDAEVGRFEMQIS